MSIQSADNSVLQRFNFVFTQDREYMRELAHIKRFLERYTGDHQFKTQVLAGLLSLEDAARECGCALDVTSLQPVFHPAFTQFRADATLTEWPLTFKWDLYLREMIDIRNSLHTVGDSGGLTLAFDSWRQRNMARSHFELGGAAQGIVHPAIAFELSSGCSVGCWFCGISAKKFGGHFSLGDSGKQEWEEILTAAQSVLGRGMQSGFCYWATDPLDNPDYLGFIDSYDKLVGVIPQTTTAIPLRNVELTRGVLQMWDRKRGLPNRFSVLSTAVLRRIHETFTPEEMLGVELVLQNKKSDGVIKFRAGRSASKTQVDESQGDAVTDAKHNEETLADGTIACVTGFLVNIVERTVRLVSPTMPSKAWPDGYIVFDSDSYQSPSDLEEAMKGMVGRNMRMNISSNTPIGFVEGIQFSDKGEGAALFSRWLKIESSDFGVIGPMIRSGTMTPIEIVQAACGNGENPFKVVAMVEDLWKSGLIAQHAAVI